MLEASGGTVLLAAQARQLARFRVFSFALISTLAGEHVVRCPESSTHGTPVRMLHPFILSRNLCNMLSSGSGEDSEASCESIVSVGCMISTALATAFETMRRASKTKASIPSQCLVDEHCQRMNAGRLKPHINTHRTKSQAGAYGRDAAQTNH